MVLEFACLGRYKALILLTSGFKVFMCCNLILMIDYGFIYRSHVT
jgi:hypothetical protein